MTVLQSLDRYYGRLSARGDVVPPGYSVEPIGYVLTLGVDGSLIDATIRNDPSGKRPKPECVPKWFSRQGTGSTPFFLWDNSAYALGLSDKDPEKTKRDHAAFKALHLDELKDESDQGLKALRLFLESWKPDVSVLPHFEEKMLKWNVGFRLDGDSTPDGKPRLLNERPVAAAHVERLRLNQHSTQVGFCLVTGVEAPIRRLHPPIRGVEGAQAAGAALVSFNLDAFASYGNEQGANAPTSEVAAFRYGAALNRMLDRGSRNRVARPIAGTTIVFWADTSDTVSETAALAAEELFFTAMDPGGQDEPNDDDAAEAVKLRDALDKLAAGRPVEELNLGLRPGTRFHVLGLAPNAARLSVRFWLDDSFEVFAKHLAEHYRDLVIEPPPWRTKLPSVQRLLVKTTALQEKFDNIPQQLAGEMMRATLTGTRYPRTLLSAAITRLRAGDDPGTGWHAAAIRMVLARDHRLRFKTEDWLVSLDRNFTDPAYQLGRLFAAVETAQRLALGRVNATIRDRYFGAASATPAGVFPLLLRGAQNHLGKLRKERKGGWLEREIEEITDLLPPQLPRSLPMESQGRFVIGYYHQRKAQFLGRPADTPSDDDDDNSEDEGDV